MAPNVERADTVKVPCVCQGQVTACIFCGGTGQRVRKSCRRCGGIGKEGGRACLDCRGHGYRDMDQPED